ncbi:hypothetical protein ACWGIP_16360, partial [Streptomyces sp. NPDC054838]
MRIRAGRDQGYGRDGSPAAGAGQAGVPRARWAAGRLRGWGGVAAMAAACALTAAAVLLPLAQA